LSILKPKYRLLTDEELSELEPEFIDFLVLNGIVADDWVKLKKEDPKAADRMITLFSDVIMEGSLRKIHFLESRSKDQLHLFRCLADKIELVGISSEGNDEVNFLDEKYIELAVANSPKNLKVYASEKTYDPTRESEVFSMLQSGCLISDGQLFKKLCLLL